MRALVLIFIVLSSIHSPLDAQESITPQRPPGDQQTRSIVYEDILRLAARREDSPQFNVLPLVELLVENEMAFDSIELMPEQRTKIQEHLSTFRKQIEEIESKYADVEAGPERDRRLSTDLRRLRYKFNTLVFRELLEEQYDALALWVPEEIGIVKALTDGPLGAAIGLPAEKREKIRKEANELGEKLKADISKYQDEAVRIAFENLSPKQREKLELALGATPQKPLENWIRGANILTLAHHLDYRKDEFDPIKRRMIINGVVYDRFLNRTGEDPEEVQKRLDEKDD
jgi:hypothetical protein